MQGPKGNLPRVSDTLHTTLGIEFLEHGDGWVKGSVPVTGKVQQELGLVHGGVYAALAEGLCSVGTRLAVQEQRKIATGQQNDTSFLRPITEGTVHTECNAIHRGRTTWVWDAKHTDDQGRLCAISRVTIAVREPRGPVPSAPGSGS